MNFADTGSQVDSFLERADFKHRSNPSLAAVASPTKPPSSKPYYHYLKQPVDDFVGELTV